MCTTTRNGDWKLPSISCNLKSSGFCVLPSLTMGNLESSKLRAKNSDFSSRHEFPGSDTKINSRSSVMAKVIRALPSRVALLIILVECGKKLRYCKYRKLK